MIYIKNQRGLAPIAMLLVLVILISTGIFINKKRTEEQKPTEVLVEDGTEASASATPSAVHPSVKPTPKPTIKALPSVSATPTPSSSPSNSPANQPMQTVRVNLGRSHADMPESASGDGIIRLMSLDPYMSEDAKIASLQYDFNLKGLEGEREYHIFICTILEGGDCVGLASVKTDKSGNASISGNSGITVTKDRPFKAIKITQKDGGFCSNSASACLRGELSLNIQF